MSKLPLPCLCLVTDRHLCGEASLVERVALAVQGGVNMVQLREKDLPGGRLLALAKELKQAVGQQALLVVNERVDVALAAGAHGVQLGEEALPITEARRLVGREALIGRSVHSTEGALRAQNQGADFLVLGTIFPSRSHPGEKAAGVGLVAQVVERGKLPVLAIGGVNQQNAPQVMAAGASGVAVVGAILGSNDPRRAAQELWATIARYWTGR